MQLLQPNASVEAVLIVDDEPESREKIASQITAQSGARYRVLKAATEDEAIKVLTAPERPNVAVAAIDLDLGRLEGTEQKVELRARFLAHGSAPPSEIRGFWRTPCVRWATSKRPSCRRAHRGMSVWEMSKPSSFSSFSKRTACSGDDKSSGQGRAGHDRHWH